LRIEQRTANGKQHGLHRRDAEVAEKDGNRGKADPFDSPGAPGLLGGRPFDRLRAGGGAKRGG